MRSRPSLVSVAAPAQLASSDAVQLPSTFAAVVLQAPPLAPASTQSSEQEPLWLVAQGSNQYQARRALSCWVEPSSGDAVLLAQANGHWWITAVLSAQPRESVTLSVPSAQRLVLKAQTLQVDVQLLDVRAAAVHAVVTGLQLVAQTLTTMAQRVATMSDHISHVCRSRVVQVDELDTLSARHIDVKAQDTYSQHAGQMMVTARETVRVDGERILMG